MKEKIPDSFVQVNNENIDLVIQILETRLPISSSSYNMGLMSKLIPTAVKLFVYKNDISENALILSVAYREDYGNDICISAPENMSSTEELKEAFATTQALDWEKPYFFCNLDKIIFPIICYISTSIKNNSSLCLPVSYFWIDQREAEKLSISLPPGFKKQSMASEDGIDFLVKSWKFTKDGTKEYVQKVTKLCPSAGIFDETTDQPASGIMMNFNGAIGMLYSSEKYRGKGLAQLCTKTLLKQLAEMGFIPSSSCETRNAASVAFHLKIGMKLSHCNTEIIYSGSKF